MNNRSLVLLFLLLGTIVSGCMEETAKDPPAGLAPGDPIPGPLGPAHMAMSDCDFVVAMGRVPAAWVEPVVPPGFNVDNNGFDTTTAGFHLYSCSRMEVANHTFTDIHILMSVFDADVQNGSWGSNLTTVVVETVTDEPALSKLLADLDVKSVVGSFAVTMASDVTKTQVWTVEWQGARVECAFPSKTAPWNGDEGSSEQWTVNETARRWDVRWTAPSMDAVFFLPSPLRIDGSGPTTTMFGGNPVYPGLVSVYEGMSFDITLQEGIES